MRYVTELKRNTAVCLAMVVLAGCSGNQAPKLSPEGQTAVQGRAVVKSADAVVTGIDAAMTAGQLPPAVGLQVLRAIRQVGVQGQVLADALTVVDAATTAAEKQKGLDAARAALATIQATLVGAVSPISDPATKTQVGTLLKQLTDAVGLVQQLLTTAGGDDLGPQPTDRAKQLHFDSRAQTWVSA